MQTESSIIKKGVGEKYTETEKQAILFAARSISRKHGELAHFLREIGLSYPTFVRWTGKSAKALPRWRWNKNKQPIAGNAV